MKIAVRETIDLITGPLPASHAPGSVHDRHRAVDYHVTQVVDGTKGIHRMIPKAIFTGR